MPFHLFNHLPKVLRNGIRITTKTLAPIKPSCDLRDAETLSKELSANFRERLRRTGKEPAVWQRERLLRWDSKDTHGGIEGRNPTIEIALDALGQVGDPISWRIIARPRLGLKWARHTDGENYYTEQGKKDAWTYSLESYQKIFIRKFRLLVRFNI
jgi:hypothetical protein